MRKVLMIAMVGVLAAMPMTLAGCASTSSGEQGIESLENMTELDYNRWKLYIQLGVKIGANRLIEEGVLSDTELELMAGVIETVATKPVTVGATSIIKTALEDALAEAGLTNDEAVFVLLIAEQELMARGALDGVLDPTTGVVNLSPRTKDMLQVIADALRSAGIVTSEEQVQAMVMDADFSK